MENNKEVKLISVISILTIVFLGLILSFYIYSFLTSSLITNEAEKKPIEINEELYKTLTDIPNYGTDVTAEEPGYGRSNPFSPYKNLASETPDENATTAAPASTPTSQ